MRSTQLVVCSLLLISGYSYGQAPWLIKVNGNNAIGSGVLLQYEDGEKAKQYCIVTALHNFVGDKSELSLKAIIANAKVNFVSDKVAKIKSLKELIDTDAKNAFVALNARCDLILIKIIPAVEYEKKSIRLATVNPHSGFVYGIPEKTLFEDFDSNNYHNGYEASTVVLNQVKRDLYFKNKTFIKDGTILQVSLSTIRKGFSGGPIVTNEPKPELLGIATLADFERFSGFATSSSDIAEGVSILTLGKNTLTTSGWNYSNFNDTTSIKTEFMSDPSRTRKIGQRTILGDAKRMGLDEIKARLLGTKKLTGPFVVEDITFENVVFDKVEFSDHTNLRLGKAVKFINCDLEGLKVVGGDVSLLNIVDCKFKQNFFSDFLPVACYGLTFDLSQMDYAKEIALVENQLKKSKIEISLAKSERSGTTLLTNWTIDEKEYTAEATPTKLLTPGSMVKYWRCKCDVK